MPLPIRTRTGSQQRGTAVKTITAIKSGADALREIEEQEAKQEARRVGGYLPHRFWMPKNSERTIIILDDWFLAENENDQGGALVVEHDLVDPQTGKRTLHEVCLTSVGRPCPYCQGGEKVSRRFMLTVYEAHEWESKKTREVHPGSRRLMAIPSGARSTYLRLQAAARKAGHTMRGMTLVMERGSEDTSYSIGEPVILDDGKLYYMMSEDEMIQEYGNEAQYSAQDPSKVIKRQDEDITPVDYQKAFSVPDIGSIPSSTPPARGGVPRALPGSRAEAKEFLADDGDDDIPYGDEAVTEAPEAPTGPARGRRAAKQPEPEPTRPTRPARATRQEAPQRPTAPQRQAAPQRGGPPSRTASGTPPGPARRQAPAQQPQAGPARRRAQPSTDAFDD